MTDQNYTSIQQHTNNTNDADEDLNYLFITQIVFYCAISAAGTFANVIILSGLLRGRLRSSECFIMNLAIADLLVCAVGIPLDIYQHYSKWWPYGKVLCHVIYPLQTSLILISILTLMGMSIERHRAICSPLKRRLSKKSILASIVVIWLVAAATVTPFSNALKYSPKKECTEQWSAHYAKYYTLTLFIMDYCIPLTIITYCYGRAGYVLHTQFQQFNTKKTTSSKQHIATLKRLNQSKKIIKKFSTAVLTFVICVLPGDCYWMWLSFRGYLKHPYDDHLGAFSALMLYANSAINPFIFGAMQMICKQNLKLRLSNQHANTSVLSRSKDNCSSVRARTGSSHQNTFSRKTIRRKVKYTSFNCTTKQNQPQENLEETKHLPNGYRNGTKEEYQGINVTKMPCVEECLYSNGLKYDTKNLNQCEHTEKQGTNNNTENTRSQFISQSTRNTQCFPQVEEKETVSEHNIHALRATREIKEDTNKEKRLAKVAKSNMNKKCAKIIKPDRPRGTSADVCEGSGHDKWNKELDESQCMHETDL
ncbi:neuropeptide Y receptor type 4-like [Xenia sp. Carnegie-2017]|uniref:neuropeptide Y receptor type 4-like n=1 Tax=Xenia sp. Carnegie-2017 TaxID=2897299 RepID=UPI001F03A2BA|nr:neuropeptide Y receptor type 4-like [Xenia sp. Carnegie-2017]